MCSLVGEGGNVSDLEEGVGPLPMGALPDRRLVALATIHKDFIVQGCNALFLVSEQCVEFGGDSGHLHFFGSS